MRIAGSAHVVLDAVARLRYEKTISPAFVRPFPAGVEEGEMFEGVYTAIVTPFDENGAIDFDAFRRLIDRQADAGIDGIVPLGTTGECPTVSVDEHRSMIDATVQACDGRMKVLAGTGANSTAEAVALTQYAKAAGADGSLQVTPYYNKPSQEGLFRHFSAVAEVGLPVVLYNVPGRTGREIAVDTVVRLAGNPGVAAVKEAGGSVDRVSKIVRRCDLSVLSGDDALTLPMMAVGAKGVISVASNLVPQALVHMVQAGLSGQWDAARDLHLRYHALFSDLFIDTNPVPVKAAMAMMNLIQESYRLPLCPMSDDLKTQLRVTLETLNLLD